MGVQKKEAEQRLEFVAEDKSLDINVVEKPGSSSSIPSSEEESIHDKPPTTARDLVTEVLSLSDDPSINPWTFRMWFIGIGLSIFAA